MAVIEKLDTYGYLTYIYGWRRMVMQSTDTYDDGVKGGRLEARISSQQKRLFKRAAELKAGHLRILWYPRCRPLPPRSYRTMKS